VFVVVAAAISAVVAPGSRLTREAAWAGADAEVLFNLTGNVLRGEHALDALLGRLRRPSDRNRSPCSNTVPAPR